MDINNNNNVNILSFNDNENENGKINETKNDDFNKYLMEIKRAKEEIKSNVSDVTTKLSNTSEEINKRGHVYLLKYLKISEYLFHVTFENFTNFDELNKFVNKLKNIIDEKLNQNKRRK